MDYSFNLPCEPRLSNSILKNRPIPAARIKRKEKPIHLDDTVPLDGKLFRRKKTEILFFNQIQIPIFMLVNKFHQSIKSLKNQL